LSLKQKFARTIQVKTYKLNLFTIEIFGGFVTVESLWWRIQDFIQVIQVYNIIE
jgi:hypothetical protein